MSKDIHDQFDRARAYAEQKAEDAARLAREGASKVREQLGTAKDSAAEAYGRSRRRAEDLYGEARDRAQTATKTTRDFVVEHPLAATAAAAAAGALVALLFPKGRAAMKALPKLAGTLGAEALAAVDRAKEAVEESGIIDRAGEAAETAKATASHAAEVARDAASQAAEAARDATRDIIRRATGK